MSINENIHDDACPVCGGLNVENTDRAMDADCIEVSYRCQDCGAEYRAMYVFDGFSGDVQLPRDFEGIIRAAVHIGNENPDDATEMMAKLVNRCEEIVGWRGGKRNPDLKVLR